MPGTLGADLILSFGEVHGATLTLYVDGEPVQIDGAKTVFADFLNQHEVSALEGSGLRVALIFWQQRTVVLSDHVVNALNAKVFPRGWKTLVPHPQPLIRKGSPGGDLVLVLGSRGAGKTAVRKLVAALREPQAVGGVGAWVLGNGGEVAVFGTWIGHHLGRGCPADEGCGFSRNYSEARDAYKASLPELKERGVRLLVADGTVLLKTSFLQLAQSLGYRTRLLELEESAEQAHTPDAGTSSAGKEDPWRRVRAKWIEEHKEKAPLSQVSQEEAITLLCSLAADAANATAPAAAAEEVAQDSSPGAPSQHIVSPDPRSHSAPPPFPRPAPAPPPPRPRLVLRRVAPPS